LRGTPHRVKSAGKMSRFSSAPAAKSAGFIERRPEHDFRRKYRAPMMKARLIAALRGRRPVERLVTDPAAASC